LKLSLSFVLCVPDLDMPEAPDNVSCPQRLSPTRLTLTELPDGESGRVTGVHGKAEQSQRLREMGFCESAVIQKIGGKRLLICELCGVRLALSDRAAARIEVELIRTGI
jgi:ferrous iron transport protein A